MVEIGFDLCEFSTHFDLQASFFTDKPAHAALTDINNALYIKTRGVGDRNKTLRRKLVPIK